MKNLIVPSLLSILAASQLTASPLFVDSFDGTIGNGVDGYTQGGSGDDDSTGIGDYVNVAPGLSYSGYQNTGGNAAQAENRLTWASHSISPTVALNDSSDSGTLTLYGSALFNLPSAVSWGEALSGVHLQDNNDDIGLEGLSFGVYRDGGTNTGYFGVNAGGRAVSSLGGTNTNGDQSVFSTGVTPTPGTTYLFLVRYDIDLDSTAMGSVQASYSIYEDGVDIFDGTEPTVWDGTFQSSKGTGFNADPETLNTLALFSGNVSYTPVIDEVRLGTTFNDIAVPEPSTYAAIAGVLALGLAIWRRRR